MEKLSLGGTRSDRRTVRPVGRSVGRRSERERRPGVKVAPTANCAEKVGSKGMVDGLELKRQLLLHARSRGTVIRIFVNGRTLIL